MSEIIEIQVKENKQLVSGRKLHQALEINTKYTQWVDRIIEKYDFVENVDFIVVSQKWESNEIKGFTERKDHLFTLDVAKEITMLPNNEKGKQIRKYFIQCESAWNTPEMILSRANEIQKKMIENYQIQVKELEQKILEDKPKIEYVDNVLNSESLLTTTIIGKDFGLSAKKLNEILSQSKIIYKQSGTWVLYSKYQDLGLAQTVTPEKTTKEGVQLTFHTLKWTEKGKQFIYNYLKKLGYKLAVEV